VDTYARLVALLRKRCSSFVAYPSMSSLYLWSGIEPPRGGIPGACMCLLTGERQRRVVEQLRRADHPCGRPVPDTPLVHYILDDYRPVEKVNRFQLLLPKRGTGY
jgi:hypothetical protein